ncbi:MAG TPA: class I SAM-dependent methyltransferase [Nitrososphaera sp.]|nr:class I SAM-dependent methyltransferase [Nitrososphaera sp.]
MDKKYRLPKDLVAIQKCRVCGKKELAPVLSLGMQYLSNFIDPDQELYAAPVELVLCNKQIGGCGLLQLRHTVPPELLYRKFWYKSGTNETMKNALADIVVKAEKLVKLQVGDIVLDIGANDGTLLRSYSQRNLKLVGFEPATNLMDEARTGTIRIFNDFFNHAAFGKEFRNHKAMIITSIAMFYDLDKPNEFVSDIVKTLHKDGVWIVQMNYLATMLENNAFDNIVHEHLEYYSLDSLNALLERHDLIVFDIELNDINGGSIRTYIKHKDCKLYPITNKVNKTKLYENKMGLEDYKTYRKFARRIETLKEKTYNFVKAEVKKGRTVHVYGASTRGNTLLQYYNLDHRLIKAAADRNPVKWGKRTAGTYIPIISEERARKERPDYFLVLPWYFIDEFVSRENEFLKSGGKFIVPLPAFKIIQNGKKT